MIYTSTGWAALVGYWSFDDPANPGRDDSGNGNDGTVYGATWITPGKVNSALSFDGVDDYVDVPSAANLRVIEGFTVATWVYPRDISSLEQIFVSHLAEGGWGFQLGLVRQLVPTEESSKSMLSFIFYNGTGWVSETTGFLQTNPSILLTDRWSHVVATYSESAGVTTTKIYVEGAETTYTGPNTFSSTIQWGAGSSYFNIGSNLGGAFLQREFNGIIDEVRIYNRVLSDSEIKALVPEPTTLLLLGLGGLALRRIYRRGPFNLAQGRR